MSSPSRDPPPARAWRPRFGLFSLLLATTLAAAGAAVLGHLLREGADSVSTGMFIAISAAAPMALMIAASVLAMLSDLRRKRPRRLSRLVSAIRHWPIRTDLLKLPPRRRARKHAGRSQRMNNFGRTLRMALKNRLVFAGSLVCAIAVAVLWGGNIGAVYPFVEVVLHGQSLQAKVAAEIDLAQANVDKLNQQIAGLQRQLAEDGADRAALEGEIWQAETVRQL